MAIIACESDGLVPQQPVEMVRNEMRASDTPDYKIFIIPANTLITTCKHCAPIVIMQLSGARSLQSGIRLQFNGVW